MLRFPRRIAARFGALVRVDPAGVRAGFGALLISSGGDLVAGLTLGSITHTLEQPSGPARARPGRDRDAGQRLRRPREPARHPDPHRHLPRVVPARPPPSVKTSPPRWCSRSRPRSRLAVLAKSVAVAFGVSPSIVGRRLHGRVGRRGAPLLAGRARDHRGRGVAVCTAPVGPRQRGRADRHRGRRRRARCRACSPRPTCSASASSRR